MNYKKAGSLRICEEDPPGKTSRFSMDIKTFHNTFHAVFMNLLRIFLSQVYCTCPSLCLYLLPQTYLYDLVLYSYVLIQMFLLRAVSWPTIIYHKPTPIISSPLSLLYFLARIYYLTYHMFSQLSYLLFVSPTKMYDSVRVKNCICFVHSYPQHLNQ